MRCVELGKVRRVLDETPSGDPATRGRGQLDSPLATRHYATIRNRRRGVTLVEMLVTLAVLLLMMTASSSRSSRPPPARSARPRSTRSWTTSSACSTRRSAPT